LDKHEGVAFGSMMSAPGIWYNGKNFAFFSTRMKWFFVLEVIGN
jgi:hypothetical protein